MYFRSSQGSSTSSVKYHSETQIKQSKGHNGELKLEHKKTTNRTMMNPAKDIDYQALTIRNKLAFFEAA